MSPTEANTAGAAVLALPDPPELLVVMAPEDAVSPVELPSALPSVSESERKGADNQIEEKPSGSIDFQILSHSGSSLGDLTEEEVASAKQALPARDGE